MNRYWNGLDSFYHNEFTEFWHAHIETLFDERSANIATLGTLFALWVVLIILGLRRTVKWELLTTALTVAIFAQAIREAIGVVVLAGWVTSLPVEFVWVIRVILAGSAGVAIYAALRDKPNSEMFLRRRWTDKYANEEGQLDSNRLWAENGEAIRHLAKAQEEIATLLEELTLGVVSREKYGSMAAKVRRHSRRAMRFVTPPGSDDVPVELSGIDIPVTHLPTSVFDDTDKSS